MTQRYHVRVVRRRKRFDWTIAALRVFLVWLIAAGAWSGVMISAIIINWMFPGHPFFKAIKTFLETMFE